METEDVCGCGCGVWIVGLWCGVYPLIQLCAGCSNGAMCTPSERSSTSELSTLVQARRVDGCACACACACSVHWLVVVLLVNQPHPAARVFDVVGLKLEALRTREDWVDWRPVEWNAPCHSHSAKDVTTAL